VGKPEFHRFLRHRDAPRRSTVASHRVASETNLDGYAQFTASFRGQGAFSAPSSGSKAYLLRSRTVNGPVPDCAMGSEPKPGHIVDARPELVHPERPNFPSRHSIRASALCVPVRPLPSGAGIKSPATAESRRRRAPPPAPIGTQNEITWSAVHDQGTTPLVSSNASVRGVRIGEHAPTRKAGWRHISWCAPA